LPRPSEDVPRLVEHYQNGELLLDEFVSRRLGLKNWTTRSRACGDVARQVVLFPSQEVGYRRESCRIHGV
jgi:Zn-dependent alcohol dehydrogenase